MKIEKRPRLFFHSVMPPRPSISIAIGSWTDKEYNGLLFPKGTPDNERLKVFATWFDHVEVNSGYHAFPPRDRVTNWVQQTPDNFVFDFKLHRDFAQSPEASGKNQPLVDRLLNSARPIIEAGKLGAFFLVLPPSYGPKRHALEEIDPLVEKLRPHPLAVELRHSEWLAGERREQTLAFFRQRQLVWIAVDMPRIEGSTIMPPVDEVTNPRLAYLRLHGRRPDWLELKGDAEAKHTYEYPEAELEEIAARVKALAAKAETVHVVANNHAQDFAPKAALELQRILGVAKKTAAPTPTQDARRGL